MQLIISEEENNFEFILNKYVFYSVYIYECCKLDVIVTV